jgi:hypothetical protein
MLKGEVALSALFDLVTTPADNDLFLHEHLTGGHGLWVVVRHFDNVVLSRSAFKQKTST